MSATTRSPVTAFLSQPYGRTAEEKVYWDAFQAGIERMAARFIDPKLEIHSARRELAALTLKQNVKGLIDRCDFTIAVVTGQNPNVLWEVGYTEAQQKPVVFLVDEGEHELAKSPVLIIEALRCPYRSAILTTLVKQGDFPLEFTEPLSQFLDHAIRLVSTQRVEPIAKVFANRELCDLPERIASAGRHIYLLTTNLSYFANVDRFSLQKSPRVFAFDPPIERGVDVRILTLDPDSHIVKDRAEQLGLGHDVARFREELRKSACGLYGRYRDRQNVSIRIYDDVPLQISLLVDDDYVVASLMARGSLSRYNVHFQLNLQVPGARETFENHFNAVTAVASKPISVFRWATG